MDASVSRPFSVLYAGNLHDYGPMLERLLMAAPPCSDVSFQFRGGKPRWSRSLLDQAGRDGRLLPFAPRPEIQQWLDSAHAFLVPMVFEAGMRRRMATSFPSKLPEFARFGKPLIVWGPEDCSAVQWARQSDRAVCVTRPDPRAVLEAIEVLRRSPSQREYYARAALMAARTDFDPDHLQSIFWGAIQRAAEGNRRDSRPPSDGP